MTALQRLVKFLEGIYQEKKDLGTVSHAKLIDLNAAASRNRVYDKRGNPWPWREALLVGASLSLLACGGSALTETVGSTGTEQEAYVIAETPRVAAKLGVRVTGALSETFYPQTLPNGLPTYAGAWYDKGVVYYYRPWIVKQNEAVLHEVVCHEVCHAVEYFHGPKHDACIARVL